MNVTARQLATDLLSDFNLLNGLVSTLTDQIAHWSSVRSLPNALL
jgi:hypothetical protein